MRPDWRAPGKPGSRSLFVRARQDPTTFGDVYVAYRTSVLAYFVRRVLDPELALDLMAETFAEVFSTLERFRGTSEREGQAFLWAVARSRLAAWHRKGEVERRHLERIGVPVPSLGPQEYERIEQLADLERFAPMLDRALRELTPQQRHLVEERIEKGRSYDELAVELDTTAPALRNMLARALRRLGTVLVQLGAIDLDGSGRPDTELVR